MKHLGRLLVLVGLLLSGVVALEAQATGGVECFALEIENPDVLYMLRGDVQGEVLVLTDESLESSPGIAVGARAYLGLEKWREQEPLHPFSWFWVRPAPDSIRVGFVLPLWGISWSAQETSEGLAGEVTYTSDEVGEPPRSSAFQGVRVRCESEKPSEHAGSHV